MYQNSPLTLTSEQAHYLAYNYVKVYPKHVMLFKLKNPFLKQHDNLEINTDLSGTPDPTSRTGELSASTRERSLRRTKTAVSDLVKCNEFDLFGTFTFNRLRVDRYDHERCKSVLTKWLENQQRIHGKFNYIIIPELHKDGAIHFHGVMGGFSGKMADSGHKDPKGRKIYNLTGYKWGFTNFSRISSKTATANYIQKYITKEMIITANKRRYWTSKGLKRPSIKYNVDEQTLINRAEGEPWQHEKFTSYTIPVLDGQTLLPLEEKQT